MVAQHHIISFLWACNKSSYFCFHGEMLGVRFLPVSVSVARLVNGWGAVCLNPGCSDHSAGFGSFGKRHGGG